MYYNFFGRERAIVEAILRRLFNGMVRLALLKKTDLATKQSLFTLNAIGYLNSSYKVGVAVA
jgi:hypothetical protein